MGLFQNKAGKAPSLFGKTFWGLLAAAVPFRIGEAAAASSSSGLFSHPPDTDLAAAWLDFLFRGAPLPSSLGGGSAAFEGLVLAFQGALKFFSLGMMALAGLLLFYHVVRLVVETAQKGVPLGSVSRQVWVPIRLVFAFALLLPLSGGLNAGQILVLKFAEAGSALATNAWNLSTGRFKASFSSLAQPLWPDMPRLWATSFEMEKCRAIYSQAFIPLSAEADMRRAGNIFGATKIPASRLSPEVWRYTNLAHPNLPLCGEYRFAAEDRPVAENARDIERVEASLGGFARSVAEDLIFERRAAPAPGATANEDDLPSLSAGRQSVLKSRIKSFLLNSEQRIGDSLDATAANGWAAAGLFVLEVVRLQWRFDQIAAQIVPTAVPPLLGHRVFSHAVFVEEAVDTTSSDRLWRFYEEVGAALRLVRAAAYGATPNAALITPDFYEITDQLGPGAGHANSFFVLNRVLNAAGVVNGLWAEEAASDILPSGEGPSGNPVARLASFGGRVLGVGKTLFDAAAAGVTTPGWAGASLLFAGLALALLASGSLVLFAAAFLPFFRFFFAVLGWLLALLEAIVALPLVALAHLTSGGEGLSGPVAKQAYWMWLSVFMRPVLILFGFLAGWLFLYFAFAFLDPVFAPHGLLLGALHGEAFAPLRTGAVLMQALLLMAATNVAFRGLSFLPERILGWLNLTAITEEPTAPTLVLPTAPSAPQPAGGARETLATRSAAAIGKTAGDLAKSAFFPVLREKTVSAPPVPSLSETAAISASATATALASAETKEGAEAKSRKIDPNGPFQPNALPTLPDKKDDALLTTQEVLRAVVTLDRFVRTKEAERDAEVEKERAQAEALLQKTAEKENKKPEKE